ncbi:hypothetical protein DYB26_012229, partial [Aphanomyces astaci]
ITKLLDEFKASSGVMVVPVPAAATTPLPLPQTSVAEVGGDKVNDGCNGATALSLERAPGPINHRMANLLARPTLVRTHSDGKAKRKTPDTPESEKQSLRPRSIDVLIGAADASSSPTSGSPFIETSDAAISASKPARSPGRGVCSLQITQLLDRIRGTKPWVQYESVASFVHEAHAPPGVAAAIQEFNKRLREFWCTSGHLLWESQPALWPLNATFTYMASRLLTIELLEMLKDIGIDEPKEVFFSMAEVAEKFVKNGCPRPRKPYPFVSMVVEDDIPGLEWSHGLDPPPTRNVRTVRTLRP